MNECQGTVANDSGGSGMIGGNPGTITIGGSGTQTAVGTCTTAGTAWGNGATGKYNSSLNFDGTDDYVDVPNPTVINNNIQQITMSAWVKTTDTGYNHILSRGTSWTAGNTILYTDGSTEYRFTVYGYTSPAQSGVAPSGNWQHVVGVYDGTQTSNNMKIYVDGVLKGTGTANLGTLANRTDSFRIANRNDSLLSGQVDDARVYNYALTANQVKTVYNNGSVNFGPSTGSP